MSNPVVTTSVYGDPGLVLEGKESVRVNSPEGPAEVVGQDVKVIAQDGGDAKGNAVIDAVRDVKLNAGRTCKIMARRFTIAAQEVLYMGHHEDPEPLVAGHFWYRTDLDELRFYNGVTIKKFKLEPV